VVGLGVHGGLVPIYKLESLCISSRFSLGFRVDLGQAGDNIAKPAYESLPVFPDSLRYSVLERLCKTQKKGVVLLQAKASVLCFRLSSVEVPVLPFCVDRAKLRLV
jgi:hypothetical protein